MKRNILILTIILSLGKYIAGAQNFVYNGYFEIHDTCPSFYSQINRATTWYSALQTPDYYNRCATYQDVSVPFNQRGYQQDCCNGNGYAGIVVFNTDVSNNYEREYMQTKLLDTLSNNKKYLASMLVNKGEVDYAITTMGMLFTDTIINMGNAATCIYTTPQIIGTTLLYDTLNWILVEDTFTANGTELYLTIGNFNINSNSGAQQIPGSWPISGWAYSYIDGVSVYDITNGICNNYWDAGYDKYIIEGDSIRLGAINTDNSIYSWANSSGEATFLNDSTDARPWSRPTQTTTYYVTKTCPNNTVFLDTVTVYVQSTMGIKALTEKDFQVSVFPNPAKDKIYIESKDQIDLTLFDLLGNKIIETNQKEIDISKITDGVYLYTGKNKQGLIKKGKIVILK